MPLLPDIIPATLQAIHARRAQGAWQSRGNTFIGASEAAKECAREIWYSFRWASPPEDCGPRTLRLFDTGHMEEQRFLDELRQVEGVQLWQHDPQTGKQWRSEIEGYIVVKPDGVVIGLPEAPKSWHIVECKSANEKNFNAIKKKGVAVAKPEHWLQVQLEMLAEGLKRALYWVVNKNTDEEYVERIRLDEDAANRAVVRLVSIATAPRPPGRIREDTTKPPCMFCRHRGICHEGQFARVHCRTCLHATPQPGGDWHCERWGKAITPEEQAVGCPAHLFVPELVPGEQINVLDETVIYTMRDGSVWIDGADAKEVAA